jgi:hypothetical protein
MSVSPTAGKTDTGANDPLAPPGSPRLRRVPGVQPAPNGLLRQLAVSSRRSDERAGGRTALSFQQGRATNVRQTDMGANDPLAPPRSPRPRRVPGVRPHPHDLLQEQPVPTRIFDERGGGRTVPKLSGGLFLSPFSRRLRITVCRSSPLGPAEKTHLRFTYKGLNCVPVSRKSIDFDQVNGGHSHSLDSLHGADS